MDPDTFVTWLYVAVDDYCKDHLPAEASHRGRPPSLSRSEVITLALFGQWDRFRCERAFHRTLQGHLPTAFPTLPDRSQFNRLVRHHWRAIAQVAIGLGQRVPDAAPAYEALDCVAARVRDRKRRGMGWMPEDVARGWSNRLGWYEGFSVLTAASPAGVITGFGFAPANTNERWLAETFFAVRAHPLPDLPSVGGPVGLCYLADSGFWGLEWLTRWQGAYNARVLAKPQADTRYHWPRRVRRWHAHYRQIAETVHNILLHTFRLDRDRPHALDGFAARLAAKVGLHNFSMWLNAQLGRPLLAFADLIAW
ncbi:MAG TPA: transposase [Chloroflexota bacterium]|nr:transposase [Chloroflexota bacterium]